MNTFFGVMKGELEYINRDSGLIRVGYRFINRLIVESLRSERIGFIRKDGFLLSAIFHFVPSRPKRRDGTKWDAASIRAKEPAYLIFGKKRLTYGRKKESREGV